jgi:uncharacterized protein (DUF1778 family)
MPKKASESLKPTRALQLRERGAKSVLLVLEADEVRILDLAAAHVMRSRAAYVKFAAVGLAKQTLAEMDSFLSGETSAARAPRKPSDNLSS